MLFALVHAMLRLLMEILMGVWGKRTRVNSITRPRSNRSVNLPGDHGRRSDGQPDRRQDERFGPALFESLVRARLVIVDQELMGFRLGCADGPRQPVAPRAARDETIALPPADNLRLAFEDADLVAQHQQLGLISGAVAKRCQGRPDITFGTKVMAARYDEGSARWTVTTDSGDRLMAQFLIMATGCLSASKLS